MGTRRGWTARDEASPGPASVFVDDAARRRPAGICVGPAHVVVYGNPAFVAAFGSRSTGMPAREVMLDLGRDAFAAMDAVYRSGRPAARWIRRDGAEWRLTIAPHVEPGTHLVYGVSFHLRTRSDPLAPSGEDAAS